ncbi:MAG: ATP-binding cassette domain-containing protein [bacterium]|nr:ATP-binding cassette domain-containing protein [bacterium]
MALKLVNISFAYPSAPEKNILGNIDLNFNNGESVGIIGKTGVGKSTLLKICTGFLFPDNGKIYFNDDEIKTKDDWSKYRKNTGLVFQFPEKQLFEETVFNDIAFGLTARGHKKVDIKEKVYSAMNLVGLPPAEYAERSPWQLCSGEQRKTAISGIVALDPDIVFLDEPTLGIDQIGVRDIENLIGRLKDNGKTVCIVSHNMDFILRFADRIIVLFDSEIGFDGKMEELFGNTELLRSFKLDIPELLIIANELKKQYNMDIEGISDFDSLIKKVELLKNP